MTERLLISERRTIAEILKQEDPNKFYYEGGQIPLSRINTLNQPRRTFDEIDVLAVDIALNGLLEPPLVAKLSREGCANYLAVINSLWKTDYQIKDLVSVSDEDGQERFHILIAGERRFRALRLLQTVGYEAYTKEFGPSKFYEAFFGHGVIDVRFCINIPPFEAIFKQSSENNHIRVPAHEEARFYYDLFSLIRQVDPDYPKRKFARKVGRSLDIINNAIKFCELPPKIQGFVESGKLSYGIACGIARLQNELNLGGEELQWWAMRAMLTDMRVPEFLQMVTEHIFNSQNGQKEMALFTDRERGIMRRAFFRETIAKKFIRNLWERIAYWKKVIDLFESGELGQENSPFSEGSPARFYRAEIVLLQQVLPHLTRFVPRKIQQEASLVLSDANRVLSQIEEDNGTVVV